MKTVKAIIGAAAVFAAVLGAAVFLYRLCVGQRLVKDGFCCSRLEG